MIEDRIALQEMPREHMKKPAGEDYPWECCGLLFGMVTEEGTIVIQNAVGAKNRAPEDGDHSTVSDPREYDDRKKTHYGIEPLELYRYEKEQREAGRIILGFYHSHPDHPAIPSEEDIREMVPGMLYLILSVSEGIPTRLRGWKKDTAAGPARELRIYHTETF